jgi:putative transferase (TIGR04331 family)
MKDPSLQSEKNILVTTALESTWGVDKPVLFLGEWCCLDSRKDNLQEKNYDILPYHWDDRKKAYNDSIYLNSIYKKLLHELSLVLNKLHNKNYSEHTWNILVGYWLIQFTAVVFDRWSMIDYAVNNYYNLETIVLDVNSESCIPIDSVEAVQLFFNDRWNHLLYSMLIEQWTDIEIKKQIEAVDSRKIASKESGDVSQASIVFEIKKIVRSTTTKLMNLCSRSNTYMFSNTYLSSYDQIKLQLSLCCDVLNASIYDDSKIAYDPRFREWNLSNESFDNKFEMLLRSLLPKFMPKTFLEGFKDYHKKSLKKYNNKKTKVIFTSNSHYSNDIFKCSIMDMIESGVRLVVGQHGGGALHKYNGGTNFDLSIANRYLSPGNGTKGNNIIGVGQLFNNQKYNKYDKRGPALLVTVAMPRYSFDLRSMVIAGQMLGYFEDQFNFYNSLTDEIKNQLNVRLYVHDYGWNQKQRWLDRFPDVQIDKNRKMNKAIRQSRLMIATYAATTYNETLASNIPTIIYWNPVHWELSKESDSLFDDLKRVGIFHTTPESAAKHVVKIWSDIDNWWYDSELQDIRKRYCRAFAHKPKGMIKKLKKVLLEEKEKYDAEQEKNNGE